MCLSSYICSQQIDKEKNKGVLEKEFEKVLHTLDKNLLEMYIEFIKSYKQNVIL